jgi:rhodanese-related sulfurtransferase
MKKWFRLILAIIVAFIAIIAMAAYKYARDSPLRISSSEAKGRLAKKDVDVVLDVRTAWERANLGLFPGSVHIPSAELDVRVTKELPNKGAKILAYCNTGQRARMAAEKLQGMGYKNVVYIAESHSSLL